MGTPSCRALSREGPALCLGSDTDRGWQGMNATDLKGGGEELIPKLFLSIAIILAIFVPEAEHWLKCKCPPAREGPVASTQP